MSDKNISSDIPEYKSGKLQELSIFVSSPISFQQSPVSGGSDAQPPSLLASAVDEHTSKHVAESELGGILHKLGDIKLTEQLELPADIELPDFSVKDKSSTRSLPTLTRVSLGDYLILKSISSGPYGKVYRAIHVPTGEKVALKRLDKQTNGQDRREMVKREISTLRSIQPHQHVCRLLNILDEYDYIYLVLPFYPNGDLFEVVSKQGCLSEGESKSYFCQILSAVKHCHDNGVIHRDLKLENFILDANNNIKLIDFGFSNFYQKNSLMSTSCGSPNYAAPEMITNQKYEGRLIDIWSLGIILYAMLVGRLPFDDEKTTKMYTNITSGRYKWPFVVNKQIEDLVDKILQVDPAKRISLEGIRSHIWIKEEFDSLELKQSANVDLNNEAFKQTLELTKKSTAELSEALEKNEPSALYTTYHLLLEKLHQSNKLKVLHTPRRNPLDQVIPEHSKATCFVPETKQYTIKSSEILKKFNR